MNEVATEKSDAFVIARRYHDAWWSGDFDAAGGYLAADLRVEVPINAYPTGSAFIRALQQTRQMASTLVMICELGGPTDAVLIYDLTLPICVLRVAEHFTISGGYITRIRQIHDTAALRAAGFGDHGGELGQPGGSE